MAESAPKAAPTVSPVQPAATGAPAADKAAAQPTTSLGPLDASTEDEFKPRSEKIAVKGADKKDRPRKRIVTNVTIHVPGREHEPYEWDGVGGVKSGNYQAFEYPPGAPVELDAVEADRILAKHGGRELKPGEDLSGAPEPVINERV